MSWMGQGLFLKNLYFTRTESKNNILQGAKTKVVYITGGKALLTLKNTSVGCSDRDSFFSFLLFIYFIIIIQFFYYYFILFKFDFFIYLF